MSASSATTCPSTTPSTPPSCATTSPPPCPAYMIPSSFVAMAAFPLTPNNKIDRKQLPPPIATTVVRRTTRHPKPPSKPSSSTSGPRSSATTTSASTTTSSTSAATASSPPRSCRGCGRRWVWSCRSARCSSTPTVAALADHVDGARHRAPAPRGAARDRADRSRSAAPALPVAGADVVPARAPAGERGVQHGRRHPHARPARRRGPVRGAERPGRPARGLAHELPAQ